MIERARLKFHFPENDVGIVGVGRTRQRVFALTVETFAQVQVAATAGQREDGAGRLRHRRLLHPLGRRGVRRQRRRGRAGQRVAGAVLRAGRRRVHGGTRIDRPVGQVERSGPGRFHVQPPVQRGHFGRNGRQIRIAAAQRFVHAVDAGARPAQTAAFDLLVVLDVHQFAVEAEDVALGGREGGVRARQGARHALLEGRRGFLDAPAYRSRTVVVRRPSLGHRVELALGRRRFAVQHRR